MEGGGRSENRPYLRKQITSLNSERVNNRADHTHSVNADDGGESSSTSSTSPTTSKDCSSSKVANSLRDVLLFSGSIGAAIGL